MFGSHGRGVCGGPPLPSGWEWLSHTFGNRLWFSSLIRLVEESPAHRCDETVVRHLCARLSDGSDGLIMVAAAVAVIPKIMTLIVTEIVIMLRVILTVIVVINEDDCYYKNQVAPAAGPSRETPHLAPPVPGSRK